MKNIVLVGFMGTGKTVIAKSLARRLKMRYVSTDDIIEQREKRPISDIFAKDGESYFRRVEKRIVKEVSLMNNIVVAAGGGVVIDEENLKDLKKRGVVICLNASAEDILERTKTYAHRPLLNVPDPLGKIRELLRAREAYYKRADYQINTSGRTRDVVIDEIVRLLERL
ncbi:MAG: shikimate kinase [Candidatus Omnitrophica bacterium]|nr:shikimate kinase [Candidatus Omnitrophota bacterium]